MMFVMSRLKITPLPAFSDNYIWMIHDKQQSIVVDPGDAEVVNAFLRMQHLTLAAILITHHHADHTGGAATLQHDWHCPVYAPDSEHPAYQNLQCIHVHDQASLSIAGFNGLTCTVLTLPGHTLDHIAYLLDDCHLFCGDVVFGAGCGRLFEGTPEQMLASLQKVSALPASTLLYPAHEYTARNIAFARKVDPDNQALLQRALDTQQCLAQGKPSLPTSLALELATNPFLRCQHMANTPAHPEKNALDLFTRLRMQRNTF